MPLLRYSCAGCGVPITRHRKRVNSDCCPSCRPGSRILKGAERRAAIADFMAWLTEQKPDATRRKWRKVFERVHG